jgi:hypothetical protein
MFKTKYNYLLYLMCTQQKHNQKQQQQKQQTNNIFCITKEHSIKFLITIKEVT